MIRRTSLFRAFVTISSVAALSLTGATASVAQSPSLMDSSNASADIETENCEHPSAVDGAPEFVDDPEALEVAETALSDLQGDPELEEPNVVQIEGSLVVSWPLKSDGFDTGSFFSVALDSDDYEVLNTGQAQIRVIDESSVSLTTWANGELQSDEIVNEFEESSNVTSSNPSTVDCIIQATGIAPATAFAIVSACSALCVVTAGAGCALCVGGFTALGSASIMACFGASN